MRTLAAILLVSTTVSAESKRYYATDFEMGQYFELEMKSGSGAPFVVPLPPTEFEFGVTLNLRGDNLYSGLFDVRSFSSEIVDHSIPVEGITLSLSLGFSDAKKSAEVRTCCERFNGPNTISSKALHGGVVPAINIQGSYSFFGNEIGDFMLTPSAVSDANLDVRVAYDVNDTRGVVFDRMRISESSVTPHERYLWDFPNGGIPLGGGLTLLNIGRVFSDMSNPSVEMRFAPAGDTDSDGDVDFRDFVTLANHFNQEGTWSDGNFDLDEVVGFSDFTALANNFGVSTASTVAVPEPASGVLAAVTCLIVWRCRRDFRWCLGISRSRFGPRKPVRFLEAHPDEKGNSSTTFRPGGDSA